MEMEKFKNRIIEIFEGYSADPKDSPNWKWIQKADQMGINTNTIPSFVPWAEIDGEPIPMVAKQDLGKHYKGNPVYYGFSSEEEARRKLEQMKKLPGWQRATSFWIEVMFKDKVVDRIEV